MIEDSELLKGIDLKNPMKENEQVLEKEFLDEIYS